MVIFPQELCSVFIQLILSMFMDRMAKIIPLGMCLTTIVKFPYKQRLEPLYQVAVSTYIPQLRLLQ